MADRDAGEGEPRRKPPSAAGRDATLALVSSVGGSVDAIVYLGIKQVFPANMTGNTVLLGIAVARADWSALLGAGAALAGFVVGIAVGAAIVERGGKDVDWPPAVTAALALECAVLISIAVGWHAAGRPGELSSYLLISPAAVAMGVQGAAIRRLGVPGVSATFVTGTLADLVTRLVVRLRPVAQPVDRDAPRGAPRRAGERSPTHGLLSPAVVLLAYGAGATVGAVAELRWGPGAFALPIVLVAAVVATAAARG